jgi:putative membrane protein
MNKFLLYLRGIAMGAADVVPGVSGGTIAFITGIYERLIKALHNIDHHTILLLIKFRFKEFSKKIDLTFLFLIFAGAATSILTLSKIIQFLLLNHKTFLFAFFFGLIIASIHVVIAKIRKWKWQTALYLLLGIVVAFSITSTKSISTPDTSLYIFLSGFIAIIAMILPGISGSYILLILDKYSFVIGNVSKISEYLRYSISGIYSGDLTFMTNNFPTGEIIILLIFGFGCILGLISFSKLLNWLFKNYHDYTISLLAGFMIGSLNVIWPWKERTGSIIDENGLERITESNILPPAFDGNFFLVIGFAVLGFIVVLAIEKIFHYKASATKKV